jgi:glycine hydroxymethyltransferase
MPSSPLDAWISDDDEIVALLQRDFERQTSTIQLIASENFASPSVLAATGSVLTNKYAEGYPGVVTTAATTSSTKWKTSLVERLTALFGADHANVQPHSGANANVAVYEALLGRGRHDPRHAPRPGWPPHPRFTGVHHVKFWKFVSYGVTPRSDDPDVARRD